MLAERFHLQLHTETRGQRVFGLQIAKGGLKIPETDPPAPPAKEGRVNAALGDSGGRILGAQATMAGLAAMLAMFLKRPVLDRTGLKDHYNFDLKGTAPESSDGRPPSPPLGAEGFGLLLSVLRQWVGLRLVEATGPVEYWVVNHVDPPTPY